MSIIVPSLLIGVSQSRDWHFAHGDPEPVAVRGIHRDGETESFAALVEGHPEDLEHRNGRPVVGELEECRLALVQGADRDRVTVTSLFDAALPGDVLDRAALDVLGLDKPHRTR